MSKVEKKELKRLKEIEDAVRSYFYYRDTNNGTATASSDLSQAKNRLRAALSKSTLQDNKNNV